MLKNLLNIFNIQTIKKLIVNKNYIKITSIVFGFIVGLLVISFYIPHYNQISKNVVLQIDRGEEVSSIVDRLYDNDVLDSKFMMKLAVFISRSGSKFKAGNYTFKDGMNYFDIINLLTDGRHSKQKLVTIPEGIWQNKLVNLLSGELNLDKKKLIALSGDKSFLNRLSISASSIEGYLLPETYYFNIPNTPEKTLKKLKESQDELFDEDARIQMALLKMNRHQILTMASIIDGESNKSSEFKRIAGVYYNRLKKRMRLQADPTVQYLIRNRRRHNKIYYKDLEINSPYNTYLHYGLPPGPINNPGKAAIEAALYPEKNDFYYFVASGDGGHVFAKTRIQHNRNVLKYRRWRLSRK